MLRPIDIIDFTILNPVFYILTTALLIFSSRSSKYDAFMVAYPLLMTLVESLHMAALFVSMALLSKRIRSVSHTLYIMIRHN